MATMGERLWDIGKSPPQFLTFLVFGLFNLLAAVVLRSFFIYGALGPSGPAVALVAAILGGIGGFFLATALFLGAYSGAGDPGPGLRIAQVIGAVIVVVILL
jgi:hypothetical protein